MISAAHRSLVNFERVLARDFTKKHLQIFHEADLPAFRFIFI